MPKSKKGGEESTLLDFGVEEGEEVSIGDVAWVLLTVPVGCILEVCLAGCSVGMGTEEWFAILVREVNLDDESGLLVGGEVLGCENTTYLPELVGTLSTGFIHLCKGDPCEKESERVVHATKVRLWRLRNFNAAYLSRQGKAIMKNALNAESGIAPPKAPAKAPAGAAPKRRAKSKAQAPQALASQGIRVGAGECIDLEADGEPSAGEYGSADASQRAHLRSILQETRQRIAGGGGPRPRQPAEGLAGGAGLGPTGSAVAERRLVAGTALNPGVLTPLPIGPSVDTSDDEVRRLKKRLNAKGDASSVLLAQAVQTSQRKNKEKKDKKEGSTDRTIRKLAELLGGKKKKRKDRGSGGHRGETSGIKPDPEGGDGSGPSSSSSSSSRSHRRRRKDDSSEDSELSYEAPLRKKAAKEPGSVMEMLVRHAQQQLDQGALLEEGGAAAGLTSGIKISTFFALLIRPFHSNSSPLVRELFALGQSIDLLRAGRLPECADSLASRFIAVHTALGDDNWQVASQLEMFPLEPVQSATVSTMLQAQRHRTRWTALEREGQKGRCPEGQRKRQRSRCWERVSSTQERGEPLEGDPGGAWEVGLKGPDVSQLNSGDAGLVSELATALPLAPGMEKGVALLKQLWLYGHSPNHGVTHVPELKSAATCFWARWQSGHHIDMAGSGIRPPATEGAPHGTLVKGRPAAPAVYRAWCSSCMSAGSLLRRNLATQRQVQATAPAQGRGATGKSPASAPCLSPRPPPWVQALCLSSIV